MWVAEYGSLYAVMRYEVLHLMRDGQALEMREIALRNAKSCSEHTIDQFRTENEGVAALAVGL